MVGRIILERKESPPGAIWAGRLGRDGCFFRDVGAGPSDGLLVGLFAVDGFPEVEEDSVGAGILASLGDRERALASDELLGKLPDARLSDCLPVGGAAESFEPEEAVWAVSDAGSLTGRVGDLGLGLTKPV